MGDNNDSAPQYPCNVAERNVLCVGASTNQDMRADFSNFGAVTVDVFAPGQGIASTIAGTELPHRYAFSDGRRWPLLTWRRLRRSCFRPSQR